MTMKICLVCTEIFGWGKYGGFGKSTRLIGRELVKRGIQVDAVIPQRNNQRSEEKLDGINILGYPIYNPVSAGTLFKKSNADIYHSQNPSLATYIAMKNMPHKKHMITFRDPKSYKDWISELRYPSISRFRTFLSFLFESNYFVTKSVINSDGLFYCAEYLKTKIKDLYGMELPIRFLPSPIEFPNEYINKDPKPTIIFLARWDRRKKPEIFFNMVNKFPDYQFLAVGKSQNKKFDKYLRNKYCNIPNLDMIGFIDQFKTDKLKKYLEKSWILVNTAEREGLPTSFLEALSYRCAILSNSNPDNITKKFGYHVKDGNFSKGLSSLVNNNEWGKKGTEGYKYIIDNFELNSVIDLHISVYNDILKKDHNPRSVQ